MFEGSTFVPLSYRKCIHAWTDYRFLKIGYSFVKLIFFWLLLNSLHSSIISFLFSSTVPVCQIANDLANEFLTELSNQIANDFACSRQANEMREIFAAACSVATLPEPQPAFGSGNESGGHSPNRPSDRTLFNEQLASSLSNERLGFNAERINPSSAR